MVFFFWELRPSQSFGGFMAVPRLACRADSAGRILTSENVVGRHQMTEAMLNSLIDFCLSSNRIENYCSSAELSLTVLALAQEVLRLRRENERLRQSVRNQCADNVCWLDDIEVGKALPEAEFLESCRRYRNQIAAEFGELSPDRMTIAQLEAELLKRQQEAE